MPNLDDDPLTDLCNILKTVPIPNSFQKFKLSAYIGFYSSLSGPESCFLAEWEMLDSEMARISSGKPLQFHLHMVYQVPESDEDEEIDGDINYGETADIQNLCDTTFRKLVRERLPKINDAPHIILTLSHRLDPWWVRFRRHDDGVQVYEPHGGLLRLNVLEHILNIPND